MNLDLSSINYSQVRKHYEKRLSISRKLKRLLSTGSERAYVDLALGIDDPYGNYSADEHKLGPQILARRTYKAIFRLAQLLQVADTPESMLDEIYDANIPYLKVGIGSEIAMLLQPDIHWVANTRSIWTHLVLKHKSVKIADEALALYREGISESKMAYKMWCAIHKDMELDLRSLATKSAQMAKKQNVEPGNLVFLWADAVANALYELHFGS